MNNKTRRRQTGGNLPFSSWFTNDQPKVNEKAELEKEVAHITGAMERLKRKLEAYERKMTYFEKQLTYYQDLAANALKMHEIYENGLAALKGEEETEEDDEIEPENDAETDLEGSSIEDSAVEENTP